MVFVTGPAHAGKRAWAMAAFGWTEDELAGRAAWDVQLLAARAAEEGRDGEEALAALADRLAGLDLVVATEVGCGVVPLDAGERRAREAAGRLACLLAERARAVVRVCCGLPQVLKGQLPGAAGREGGGAPCSSR